MILLEEGNESGQIDVMYHCPPAKAIGAIGMREDTMPDIVILVEDDMAKALFMELKESIFPIIQNRRILIFGFLKLADIKTLSIFMLKQITMYSMTMFLLPHLWIKMLKQM